MGKSERATYLKAIRSRYRKANKKQKTTILDEFCAVCRYNRKYAIRILTQPARKKRKAKAGRKPVYAYKEILTVLKHIWMASDQMCSKKLEPAIPLWLPFYEQTHGSITAESMQRLITMSAATIDRLLKPLGFSIVARGCAVQSRAACSRTRYPSGLKTGISLNLDLWRLILLLIVVIHWREISSGC